MSEKAGRFIVGIGAIIENTITNKILLLLRSSHIDYAANIWDDVGGRMRQFELPEETLRREILEETGISNIDIIKPIDVSHYYRGNKTQENEMIVITYWCQTSSNKVKLSKEHSKFKWVVPKEIVGSVSDTNLKRTIHKFILEKSYLN